MDPRVGFGDKVLAAGLDTELEVFQRAAPYHQRGAGSMNRTGYTAKGPLIPVEHLLDGCLHHGEVRLIAFELPFHGDHFDFYSERCLPDARDSLRRPLPLVA